MALTQCIDRGTKRLKRIDVAQTILKAKTNNLAAIGH
jgi:hypothetical protein